KPIMTTERAWSNPSIRDNGQYPGDYLDDFVQPDIASVDPTKSPPFRGCIPTPSVLSNDKPLPSQREKCNQHFPRWRTQSWIPQRRLCRSTYP
ncbi:hypothetical protein EXIGLDRAFT_729689, partial [Exidia glandulosa HHB12029]